MFNLRISRGANARLLFLLFVTIVFGSLWMIGCTSSSEVREARVEAEQIRADGERAIAEKSAERDRLVAEAQSRIAEALSQGKSKADAIAFEYDVEIGIADAEIDLVRREYQGRYDRQLEEAAAIEARYERDRQLGGVIADTGIGVAEAAIAAGVLSTGGVGAIAAPFVLGAIKRARAQGAAEIAEPIQAVKSISPEFDQQFAGPAGAMLAAIMPERARQVVRDVKDKNPVPKVSA